MDTKNGSKPQPPPAATAEADSAAVQAQVVEYGTTQKDAVAGAIESEENGAKAPKKAPDAGMKNYFVRDLLVAFNSNANLRLPASVQVWDQVRLSANSTLLSHLHWLWHHHAAHDHCLWCVLRQHRWFRQY